MKHCKNQLRRLILPLCLLGVGLSLPGRAASITWNSAANIDGDTDVASDGSLVYAYYFAASGGPTTVNGVAFTASPSATSLGGGNVTMNYSSGPYYTYNGTGSPWTGLSSAYQTVLEGGPYGTAAATITLNNLTSGHEYLVQFWVDDSRTGYTPARYQTLTSAGGNSVIVSNNVSNVANGLGAYAIGAFVASGTTQTFTDTAGGYGSISQINAIQVRDLTAISSYLYKANNNNNLNLNSSWVGGMIPGSTNIAVWDTPVTSSNAVSLGGNTSWMGLRVANPGGAVTINDTNTLILGASGIDLSSSAVMVNLDCPISNSVSASWNVAANQVLNVIGGVASGGSTVTTSLTGPGTVNFSGANALGALSVSAGTGVLNAGSITAVNGGTGTFSVTGTGAFLQTGGSIGVSGYTMVGYPTVSSNPGQLILTGGTFATTAEFLLGYGGNGVMTIGGTAVVTGQGNLRFGQAGSGTVNLFGGLLTVSTWSTGGGGSANMLLLSGGTLAYGGGGGAIWGPVSGLTAYVSTNASALSDNGKTFSIAQPLLHHPALGATVDGGIIKIGAGNLTLSATNTYTGPTSISNGMLTVNGALKGAGNVSVYSGAALGGTGVVAGAVSVLDGGTIAPGAGTLTVSNLTLGANANLVFTLGTAGSPSSGSLKVNGNLVLDGILNVYDNGNMSTGAVYAVINYTGALTNRGLVVNPNTQWNVAVDTSVTNYVQLTATQKYPFLEITNGGFAVTSTYTNLGGLIHGSVTLPLWYEVRDQTNRLWDYGSLTPNSPWSITVRHLRGGTNTVTLFAQDASGNFQSNSVPLVMSLGSNSPARPRPTPAEIWWGGTCHNSIPNPSGPAGTYLTYSALSQLMNTNLSWNFVKQYQDGFFLHGYVWVNGAARMTNWAQVGQSISRQLLPYNGKYWLEDGWSAVTNDMSYGQTSATGQNGDLNNMFSVGCVVGEISEDSGANWSQFCAWHPDWPTNDIQCLMIGNTNNASPAYPYPSGQWRDYATGFHALRPGVKFGWTWSPVWFHWQNGPALDGDAGVFTITSNGTNYPFNWDFYYCMNDTVAVNRSVGVPYSFASDCPWDYYGFNGSLATGPQNRQKIRNYEQWLQAQCLRHTMICNYSQLNSSDTNVCDLAYETNSLNTMYLHQQEGGRANSYRFESWYADPYAVVPETQPGTYTHLALSAIKYMKGIKDTNGTLEPLNLGLVALGATNVISITNNGDVACLPALTVSETGTGYLVARYFNQAGLDITAQIQSAEGYCHTNMLQPGQSTTITQFVGAVAGAAPTSTRNFTFEVFWNPQDPTGVVRDRKSVSVTGAAAATANPLAWYRFENNATDSSGNGLNLTLAGNPGYASGCVGQALSLNGGSQTATAGYNSLFAQNSYTVSEWIYLTNYPANGTSYNLLSTRTTANTYGFDIQIFNPSGTPYVHGDVGTGSAWINTAVDMPGSTPSLNTWHLITYVVDNGAKLMSLYFDGTLVNTYNVPAGSTPLFMKSNQTLQLLGSVGGAYRLDELRIYGSALNGGQVAALSVLAPSNTAPILATIPNCTLTAGQVLIFTNSASDPDSPPQTLTFNLLSGPGGATVNLTNGVFSWRPSIAQSPTTNMIWVTVADNGTPSLNATQSFVATVLPPVNPTLGTARPAINNGMFNLQVNGNSGPDYILYGASNLTPPVNWQPLKTNLSAAPPFTFSDPATNAAVKFYRVQLAP